MLLEHVHQSVFYNNEWLAVPEALKLLLSQSSRIEWFEYFVTPLIVSHLTRINVLVLYVGVTQSPVWATYAIAQSFIKQKWQWFARETNLGLSLGASVCAHFQ